MTQQTPPSGRTVAKSAIWYTASNFLTKSLGFLTIPLFTRIMSQEEFGTFNAFAAVQIVVIAVLGLESFQAINRARFDFDKDELKSFQLSILTLGTLLTGGLTIALLVLPGPFEAITSLDRQYLLIMAIYVMFYPSFHMFQAYQRVQYRFKLSASLAFTVSITATAISVILVVALSDALMGRLVGYYIPFAIVGLVFYVYYWAAGRRVKVKYWKYAIPLCTPLIIATVGAHGMSVSSRIVVQHVDTATSTALVALASTITSIVIIFITTLNHAWSPWLMDCLSQNDFNRARRSFVPIIAVVTLACLTAALLAPEAIAFLGGAEYQEAARIVPSFVGVALYGMIATQYIYVQTFYKSIVMGGLATLAVAVLNTVLLVIGVQRFGYESAGYIVLLSHLILILAHKAAMRWKQMPDIFTWRYIGIPMVAVVAVIPLSLRLMDSNLDWLRYSCAAILAVVVLPIGLSIVRRKKRKAA
ncbi:MAG: lipopolysaccharide biosynthesis protein [Canibacter sp.]